MGPPSLPGSCADLRTAAICRLLSAWRAGGRFEGELASSALSTATASFALELFRRTAEPAIRPRLAAAVRGGLQWLATHQNADGGFGDTPGSPSNSSTTVLGWVALGAGAAGDAACEAAAERAADWLSGWVQGLSPETLSRHILASYGDDRTFSVPILTMCALGGRFGHGPAAWRAIPTIPFEVAAVPRRWFPRLGLPMVSYALPALIAMGQVRHHHCPSRNPLARLVRAAVRRRTLRILGEIQPRDGGFLEAAPLTSFVAMSLIGSGAATHPVVSRAVDFLLTTVR
ncbi:MAG: prenyltransferase/squalene oxidase repeat-containing protein, partial [Acidobacteriota bacterium]